MLLAGLGVGALASQLGAVTVSSVPDELSGEVGGLQNTLTNLGASIGTALAGAVLISALTSSVLSGLERQPGRARRRWRPQANVELASGVPFVSDDDLRGRARRRRTSHPRTPTPSSRRTRRPGSTRCGRRSSVLAVITAAAIFAARRLPDRPTTGPAADQAEPASP